MNSRRSDWLPPFILGVYVAAAAVFAWHRMREQVRADVRAHYWEGHGGAPRAVVPVSLASDEAFKAAVREVIAEEAVDK